MRLSIVQRIMRIKLNCIKLTNSASVLFQSMETKYIVQYLVSQMHCKLKTILTVRESVQCDAHATI